MGHAVTSFTKPNMVENPQVTAQADDFIADSDDIEEAGISVDEINEIVLNLTPEVCGTRLDKVISTLIPQYSRSRIQQWMEAGHVSVDGKIATTKMIAYGDENVIVLPQPAPDEHAYEPEEMALDVVYEDDDIIVINKPAGLVVHPAAGNWSGTLLNGLLFRWSQLGGVPRAGIVHRLDKDTSGLMVVAKNLESQTDLVRQLQARTVKRHYLALVWGTPQLNGTIDKAMARHPRDRIKMAVSDSLSAKTAVTHYERLATGAIDGRLVSLMRCQLETGRTHQIRVHMLSLGFALVGDTLYGKQHLMPVFPRQALHATRLGLIHPDSGEDCAWYAPLPDDFEELLARAGIVVPETLPE
ncbi:RluA family pseudouridine synthase [Glaciimonas soli]|uniref:Pseudouridine synthase n=1 Tax=Glaciimonas soli TaxID=2590999 RepID=A0A843YPB5_9BURK|nr:RluA family pseudouridine synthase [Glaciimonas soli]MQQ99141.1 RluA family pseudouridine synthase [Glaciimonas soli]